MNEYVAMHYGVPCRGCGYAWTDEPTELEAWLAAAPARYRALLAGHDGREMIAGLTWSAGAYVAHVADNTRIWAERVASVALGAGGPIAGYDQDELAAARNYPRLPVAGSLWLLERAIGDWRVAESLALAHPPVVLHHLEQGELPFDDVRRVVVHELVHHERDVATILGSDPPA